MLLYCRNWLAPPISGWCWFYLSWILVTSRTSSWTDGWQVKQKRSTFGGWRRKWRRPRSKPSNKEIKTVFSSKFKHRFAVFVKGYWSCTCLIHIFDKAPPLHHGVELCGLMAARAHPGHTNFHEGFFVGSEWTNPVGIWDILWGPDFKDVLPEMDASPQHMFDCFSIAANRIYRIWPPLYFLFEFECVDMPINPITVACGNCSLLICQWWVRSRHHSLFAKIFCDWWKFSNLQLVLDDLSYALKFPG